MCTIKFPEPPSQAVPGNGISHISASDKSDLFGVPRLHNELPNRSADPASGGEKLFKVLLSLQNLGFRQPVRMWIRPRVVSGLFSFCF